MRKEKAPVASQSPPELSPCRAHACARTSSRGTFYKEKQPGKLKTPQIYLHGFISPHPGSVIQHFCYKSFIKGSPRMTGRDENNLEPNKQLLRVMTINLHNYQNQLLGGFANALSANSYL